MLRRQRHIHTQIQRLVDAGLFALSFWLAHWVRSNWIKIEVFGGTPEIPPFDRFVWYLPVVFFLAPFFLETQGFYNRSLLSSRKLMAWQLLKACVLTVTGLVMWMFLVKQQEVARSVPLYCAVISFVLVAAKEQLLRWWLQSTVGRAQMKKRLLLVGTTEDTARLRQELARQSLEGMDVAGCLNLNESPIEQLVDLLHDHSPNGVILTAKHTYFGSIEQAIEVCEREGVEVWLMADFFKTQVSRTTLDEFQGRPMLVFRSVPEDSWQSLAKRVLDFAGSIVLLLGLSWFFGLVALIIKRTSPGPVLFRQLRSGLNGQPFTMIKFRSMVSEAEQLKHELAALNEMSGPVFKVTADPRVTRFGRFMRKFSIDELPQLWNVLRGEMSLVGPRPLPVAEVKRFDDYAHRRRLSVKPGLTCLWQVSGRNEVRDFKDWVRLDLEYIDNWSLWLDVKILLRTIPVVMLGTGAK
ncbi:MAG: sugar transferase [Verrucomicrobia bacterium]|nr:sugar transferase [Verrucomicrobiota bacterium]